jgi:hypothetical protein
MWVEDVVQMLGKVAGEFVGAVLVALVMVSELKHLGVPRPLAGSVSA